MQFRFSLRAMFLSVFVVAVMLWFFGPVADINSTTVSLIQPGMTEEQVLAIVGAPAGWYDGVGGIRTNAPANKFDDRPSWIGLRGELIVDLDDTTGRVAKSTFYPVEVSDWSPVDCVWERFTRAKYLRLSVPSRICFHLAMTGITVFMLAIVFLRADRENTTAFHGLIGLGIGAILAIAIFSHGFFSDLILTTLTLSGPILGAIAGILVGFVRCVFLKRPATNTADDYPAQATQRL